MARFYTPQVSEFPFHITGRRHNRAAYDLELSQVWQIMSDHLFLTHHFFKLEIHQFVLMPNHFHLVCSSRTEPLGTALGYFMRETSKTMNMLSGKSNQVWGSRYYRCEVQSYHYFMSCYKYVYQNPFRAGLTTRCENWPYSTLHGKLGKSHSIIPTVEDTLLFTDRGGVCESNLGWLNTPPSDENLAAVQAALKKKNFKLPQLKNKRAHFLEDGLF